MIFYIKCLVNFEQERKIKVRGPEDLTEQELRHRLNKRYAPNPVTKIRTIKTEEEEDEFFAE